MMNQNNWMEKLNEEQLESVIVCDKPLRIVAGAGSGKTRVITTKICYLITALEIAPTRILAVTFTNKAANEMKERVREMLQSNVEPFISTFHSMCTRILRIEAENCGLQKNFTIIDQSRQEQIIRKILKEKNITVKSPKEARNILYPIGDWKNSFIDPTEASSYAKNDIERRNASVYKEYARVLKENNYVDFDDLLLKVHQLFKNNPESRDKWANKFDYILVDEFQDTNQIQFDIVCWLNANKKTITVVGDPDQTIYTWRGAEMHIIMDFDKKFTDSKTIHLEKNYRSTQKILNLANGFIEHNKERLKKRLYSLNDNNLPIRLSEAQSQPFEARYVATQIKDLVENQGYKYSDIFILYRINALSANFERTLTNTKIPFQVSGGISFRDRKVIKDISSMIISVVAQDSFATERVLANIPKVGPTTIQKLEQASVEAGITTFDLLVDHQDVVLSISRYLETVTNVFAKAKKMYEENKNVLEITKYLVAKLEYEENLKVKDESYEDNKQHIKTYFDQMREFDETFNPEEHGTENRLDAFCQSDLLGKNGVGPEAVENAVTLMTIHAAKGLENKVVFVVGVNEGIFPSARSYYSQSQLEEERRALYVAITRAKEILYITYVDGEFSYLVNGNLHASRFISELDHSLLETEKHIFFHSIDEMSSSKNTSFTPTPSQEKVDVDLKPGDRVTHILFGEGVVTKILNKQFIAAFNDPKWKVQTVPILANGWKKL
jgi:DNA helicase-2/ATP-dependent DNA helicase PcrA